VSTLVETVGDSLDLLREVVREPLFAKKDFKRVKAETLDDVSSIADNPVQTARAVWRDAFFGSDSPFGAPDIGTPASVGSITVKDVKAYWSTWWVPAEARIFVSGAIDEAKAKELLEARFADWQGPTPPAAMPPTAKNPDTTRIVFVEKPGAVQSVIRAGDLGPLRSAPDWWAVDTMNSLLGGMFSSRINLNLREAHGWSYGAFSGFAANRLFGTFTTGASVQADATAPAVMEVVKEIRGIREAAPSAEELATGKDALRLSLAGSFETNGQITGTLADLAVGGLPVDWLANMPGAVAKVTADDVLAAARAHLDPDHLLIVVVGPKTAKGDDGVEHETVAELEKLGLGKVEVRSLWTDATR
jgi:zinc protease